MTITAITEADERAGNKETALANLAYQVRTGETAAVIDMYERAAWNVGASVAETEEILASARGRR